MSKEDFKRILTEQLKAHIKYLEWAQTLVIEQTLTIPVPVGTYDTIIEPEDYKLWYLGYIEVSSSSNTTVDAYIKSLDTGGESLVLSVDKSSVGSKDFKLDQGANARTVQIRLRTVNSGTASENQTLILRGIEVSK